MFLNRAKLYVLYSIAILISAFFSQCTDEPLAGEDDLNEYELNWESASNLSPLSMAIIRANRPFEEDSISITVGDTAWVLPTDGDSTVGFLIPQNMSPGLYSLTFKGIIANKTLTMTVAEKEPIDAPSLLQQHGQQFDSILDNMILAANDDYKINIAEVNALKKAHTRFTNELNDLSAGDKEKVAAFLRANGFLSLRNTYVTTTDSFYAQKRDNNLSPDDELKTLSTGLIASKVTATAASLGLAYLLKTVPATPWGLVAAGLATATAAGAIITHNALAARAVNCQGVIDKLEADLRKKAVDFTVGEVITVDTKAAFRTVERKDKGSDNSLAKEVTNQAIYAIEIYNDAIDYIERIESFLGTDVINLKKSSIDIDDEPNSRVFQADVSNFSVGNVTSGVTVDANVNDGRLELTANGSQETNFAFDLIYSDSETGSYLSQEFDAYLNLPIDSIPIYEAAVVGRWKVIGTESGSESKLTLLSDGTGFYDNDYDKTTGEGGDDGKGNWFVSWRIEKINERYHLREFGFWHSGFEGYRVFDIEFDQNFLTYPVNSFKTYTSFDPRDNAVREYIKQ